MLSSIQNPRRFVLVAALVGTATSLAHAQSQQFDVNGATAGSGVTAGGTYLWEDANWQADNAAVAGSAQVLGTGATTNFIEGSFPRFSAGTDAGTSAYTITANANHSVAGMFVIANGGNVTLNGPGIFSVPLPASGLPYQGFLVNTGRSLMINNVIAGAGGVQPNLTGNLFLNGANTYTGGTNIAAATLVNFNNGSAFGTGPINLAYTNAAGTVYAPLLASGGTTITLANAFTTANTTTTTAVGVNFASSVNTPVVSTGGWTLGTIALNLRNNGGPTSPLSLNGVISGSAGIVFSGNANAAGQNLISLGAVNAFSGPMTVGLTGSTNVRLRLAVTGAIASSSSVVLAGGTLDAGGVDQIMSITTLGLTAASTIDFSGGTVEIDFANSAGLNWTGATLNLVGFDPGVDSLRFGTDANGLTAGQLAKITVAGAGAGTATLDANGFVVVPEPASLAAIGLVGFGLMRRRC